MLLLLELLFTPLTGSEESKRRKAHLIIVMAAEDGVYKSQKITCQWVYVSLTFRLHEREKERERESNGKQKRIIAAWRAYSSNNMMKLQQDLLYNFSMVCSPSRVEMFFTQETYEGSQNKTSCSDGLIHIKIRHKTYHNIVPWEDKTKSFVWLHSMPYSLEEASLQFLI